MDMTTLMDRFCDEAKFLRGLSDKTILRYRVTLRAFMVSQGMLYPPEVKRQHIETFLFEGRRRHNWKPRTYLAYLAVLRVFFDWCIKHDIIEHNPASNIEKPRVPQRLRPKLTREQVKKILRVALHYPYPRGKRFYAARNHAMISVFVYAGLRLNELIHMHMEDVDIPNSTLKVRQGKGNKQRILPIADPLANSLTRYLKERQRLKKTCPQIFTPLYRNVPIADSTISDVFETLSKAAKTPFQAHKLRHTFATLMLEGGCDIYTLSRMMGHSKIETTTIYLAATPHHLREQMEKHPLNFL